MMTPRSQDGQDYVYVLGTHFASFTRLRQLVLDRSFIWYDEYTGPLNPIEDPAIFRKVCLTCCRGFLPQ